MKHKAVTQLLVSLVLMVSPGMVLTQDHPTASPRPPKPGDVFLRDRASHRPPGLRDDLFPTEQGNPYARDPERYWRAARFRGSAYSLSTEGDEVWVRHYASSLVPSYDMARAIAVDADGNIHVTGSGDSLFAASNYVTVKYDSSGAQQWVAHYNGPANGSDDGATVLALDESGNVYVTGYSYGGGSTGDDYATIKYNAAGVQQWVARYNGSANGGDGATALALDAEGNVYVTGGSYGSGTSRDYATIKYGPNGVEQWVARYYGPDSSHDEARDLAVDEAGNVYVTGGSLRSGSYYDYATVKYSPDGIEQWVARYNGPGNSEDYANTLAVDDSGNVYVTGASEGDYATLKYGSDGVEQWVARYNGLGNSGDYASALAMDTVGNVYVTGISYGSGTYYDYATVKYSPDGVEQWVARYSGPDTSRDEARDLAVDDAGNVYVTGDSRSSGTYYDYATVKYSPDGVEQWVNRYNGPGNDWDTANALAADGSGNVYVTGYSLGGESTGVDYATIKYNSAGAQQWVARYNGTGNSSDRATALAVDSAGNVYVTGMSVGSATADDYATVKYSPDGVEQWVARYNGPGNSGDYASALAVDDEENVYVTGYSNLYTSPDYATIKYNSAGAQQWVACYNGTGNSDDQAAALAVDGAGNVYVTGMSVGSGTANDYATVKYSPDGVEQWVTRYNGTGNSNDRARALAVDGSGNAYVTGCSEGSGTSYDYATVKYSPDGALQWVARYYGQGNSEDYANALAVDGSGNVFVTGTSEDDYATVKYGPDGIERWAIHYNGPGNSRDYATALAMDAEGNVYVTGGSYGSGTSRDYATIKYNSDGAQQWVVRYNGPGNSYDYASTLAVDSAWNVYVTGTSEGDYATVKYGSDGALQGVARYNGPGNSEDYAIALAVDGSGNAYVTGSSFAESWFVYTTIKYSQFPVAVEDEHATVPVHFGLHQNYPNPFNPVSTIRYDLPKGSVVLLVVYDILGREVSRLVDSYMEPGYHQTMWDSRNSQGRELPSGIYIARLVTPEYSKSIKMVLLK